MKTKCGKNLRRRYLYLLAAVLLLTAGCFGIFRNVYAYEDEDDGPDRTPSTKYSQTMSSASALNMAEGKRYVLEVDTSILSGDSCKYIIVRYYASEANKAKGIVSTQYLTPGSGSCSQWKIVSASENLSDIDAFMNDSKWSGIFGSNLTDAQKKSQQEFFRSYAWELTGEKSYNYRMFTEEPTIPGLTGSWYGTVLADGYAHMFGRYANITQALIPHSVSYNEKTKTDYYISGYPAVSTKVENPTTFDSYTTEYVIFRSEYGIYQLESLDFYCESAQGVSNWMMTGWALYETNWNQNFRYGIDNFAFISDGMAFDIAYDKCLGKSQKSEDLDANGFVVNRSGYYRFVLDTKENREAKDAEGGALYSYFFTTSGGVTKREPVTYTFSVNLMDEYGAGVEQFNRTPAPDSKLELAELLDATIYYEDKDGHPLAVSLPVITNAVLEYVLPTAEYAVDTGGSGEKTPENYSNYERIAQNQLLSVAQQGDSLIFSVTFPEAVTLTAINLNYHSPYETDDGIIIQDVQVYNNANGRYTDRNLYTDPQGLEMDITPRGQLVYETDQVSGGVPLENLNREYEFELKTAGAGEKTVGSYDGMYLFSFTTSTVDFTETLSEDVSLRFEYLSTVSGEKITEEYDLKALCEDFYGYNPAYNAVEKTLEDGSYLYNVQKGRTVRFLLELRDVGQFTKIVFLKGDDPDEWQIDGIEIRQMEDLGERILTPLADETCGNLVLNRIYDRDVSGGVIFSKTGLNILLQPNSTVEFDLEDANVDINIEKRNYHNYYYNMPYEIAVSDLHFDEAAWNYEVRVHVSPNSVLTSANKGDSNGCGSNNLYYFQLVFSNGSSGYVLSNALLKSDCFRAGETESFTISVNEDMGDVVAVKIIPDDMSESCDPLDKLCIDYIEIIKENPKTANKRYICSDVGWVKLEYRDSDEDVASPGRSESEIATICPVGSSGYMLDLEFNIAIGEYYDINGLALEQFYGNMTADITYETVTGERKVVHDYPVVQKMYEYAGKNPKSEVYHDGTGQEYYVSDRDYMFREGRIVRFVWSCDDIAVLKSITLNCMGYKSCALPVKDIAVKILTSSGHRIINSMGDYEIVYDVDPILLTDEVMGKSLPRVYNIVNDMWTPITFNFGENNVGDLDDTTELNTIIGRVPQSVNDKLNLYIYMYDGTPTPAEGGYNLTARTYYSSAASSNIYMTSCNTLKARRDNGQLVLYAMDLSATNMSVLTNLQLVSDVIGRQDIQVQYAIVQQVRNGVVISTYKVKFGGAMVAYNASGLSMQNKVTSLGCEQVVSVALGEDTQPSKLVDEQYDIALAIRYTSSSASDDTVFISPYVFATDSGEGNVAPGKMLEFHFNEAYVRDIVGIDVIALNGVKASISAANVLCYETGDDGQNQLTGWFSIDKSGEIKSDVTKFSVTDNSKNSAKTLKRASFSFKTMEYASQVDSGGTAPIKMIINYRDVNKNIQTKVIDDIRQYAGGSEYFTAGQTANLSFFLKGVDSVNYIKLIPYDDSSATQASWNLESLSFGIDGSESGSFHTIRANRTLVETTDDGTTADDAVDIFNLSSIKMTLTASVGSTAYAGDELENTISMQKGETLQVLPVINGSVTGAYYVRVEKSASGNYSQVGSQEELAGTGYAFTPTETGSYRLTFTVVENPAIEKTIKLTVNP